MRGTNLRFLHEDVHTQVTAANDLIDVLKTELTPVLSRSEGEDRKQLERAMQQLAEIAGKLARNAAKTGQTLGEFVVHARRT